MPEEHFGLISVIMAAYNAEKTIRQAMESVLRQTYPHLELLVVDDGSEDGTVRLAEQLAAKDSRVRLIVNPANLGVSRSRRHPWKAGRIAAVLQVQLRQMLAVLRLGKRGRPVYFWIADKMLLPYLAARARGMEVNYFIYGNVEREGRPSLWTALSGKLIRYMASHADWLCMESPRVRKEWPGLEGKGEKSIHLYTGVNEKPDFSARGPVLGMVCRLTPGKHVIESIRAMAEIHKAYPEWRLEIIGSGIQEPECRALIRQLDAGGYIELQGWVEHARLYSQVKNWKYLLFPTDTEGMPNGLVEMMGQGIPAIASPAGGIADLVQDGKNGMLLPDGSVEGIRQGMERGILTPEPAYREMAQKAYETIRDAFTLEAAQKAAGNHLQGRRNR